MTIVDKAGEYVRFLTSYIWWKDVMDRCLALVLLIVLSPFLLIIAMFIMLDSPGNPVFSQERIGKNGKTFILYKFRSMHKRHDDSKYLAFMKRYVEENSFSMLD